MKTPEPNLVFVYGTLKSGHGNHGLLRGSRLVTDNDTVAGHLISLGGFPGLIKDPAERTVGELYEVVDAEMWRRLDRLEGYNPEAPAGRNMYVREQVTTEGGTPCFVYFWNGKENDGPRVTDNRW